MATQKEVAHTQLSRRAYAIYYDGGLRDRVKGQHHGRYLALEVATGDYEIADSIIGADTALRPRHPLPAQFFIFRIGYPAAVKMGGQWQLEDNP